MTSRSTRPRRTPRRRQTRLPRHLRRPGRPGRPGPPRTLGTGPTPAARLVAAAALAIATAAPLLTLAGCSKPGTSTPASGTRISLLDAFDVDPLSFDPATLETVESIDPAAALRAGRLREGRGIADLRAAGDAIAFATVEKRPNLVLDVDLSAREVNFVSMLVDPGSDRLVQPGVEWMRDEDKHFMRERRAMFRQVRSAGAGGEDDGSSDGSTLVRLFAPVGDSPNWSGHLRSLSIAPTVPPGISLTIHRIDLLRIPFAARKGLLDGVAQDRIAPFSLSNETRDGIYLAPPFSVAASVEVPEGGILEFGYGVIDSDARMPGDGVHLTVRGRRAGTSRWTVLFDESLDPKHDAADRGWHASGPIRLEAFDGEVAELAFETRGSAEPPFDDRYDSLIVSNPIVYRPGRASDEFNVVLVSLDTLRADHLSGYGYARPTSPNLDSLAKQATVFTTATSQAPRTIDSHMSLFTSVFPSSHRMLDATARLNRDFTTIPQRMRAGQYHTAAFTESGFLGHQYGFQRGFDSYWEKALRTGTGGNVDESFGRAVDWIERNHEKKFFLFVHTYEAHVPYCPADPYFGLFREGYEGELADECVTKSMIFRYNSEQIRPDPPDLDYMISVYDEEIRYLDEYVGRLMRVLDDTGIADETLVVVLSDHGEEFMEHIMFGKHAHAIWQPQIHVPLIVRDPKAPEGRRVDDPVSLIDVAPTILDFAGLDIPDQFRGTSLVPYLRGEAPSREEPRWQMSENHGYAIRASIRDERYKLIHNYDLTEEKAEFLELYEEYAKNLVPYGELELYDLSTDPEERRNLAGERPEITERMRAELRARLERARDESKPPRIEALDSEAAALLEALGYTGREIENDRAVVEPPQPGENEPGEDEPGEDEPGEEEPGRSGAKGEADGTGGKR